MAIARSYVTADEGLTHLITFADNNAVGYFQKQARPARCAALRLHARTRVRSLPACHVLTGAAAARRASPRRS